MKAVTVEPGRPDSLMLAEREPPEAVNDLLVEAVAVGICSTDHAIIESGHGAPPDGRSDLVLGHEALGRVVESPEGSSFQEGDLVAPIVRRPDPLPCPACAQGRWDMCLNGLYVERGIQRADGYASDYFTLEVDFAVHVPAELGLCGVLVEPASVVTKAWARVDDFAGLNWRPIRSILITGAGPIGLLAALLGVQRGLDVHVLDRVNDGPKPDLVTDLGAKYHVDLDSCREPDVVIECTGAPTLIPKLVGRTGRNSIVCLTGVSEHVREDVDIGELNRELVLENDVVLGSVNASRSDYERAVLSLVGADQTWLSRLITRRVPGHEWRRAYDRKSADVKTVLLLTEMM